MYEPALAALEKCFEDATDAQAAAKPAPAEWSALEVVAHLVQGERGQRGFMDEIVGGYERWVDNFGGNIHAHVHATVAVYPTIRAMLAELRRNVEETLAYVAALPVELAERKGAFYRLGFGLLQADNHILPTYSANRSRPRRREKIGTMSQLIAVIGNTGVGKTSLVRALRAAHPFNVGLEGHAERPFQALFKTDARYALANQFDYMLLRAEQERELRRAAETGLVDGGLDQDFQVFTQLFRARGYLESAEFELCQRLYTTIRANQPLPDLVILLTANMDAIRQRLAGRERINIASATI